MQMDKRSLVVWVIGDKFEIMEKSVIGFSKGRLSGSFFKTTKPISLRHQQFFIYVQD